MTATDAEFRPQRPTPAQTLSAGRPRAVKPRATNPAAAKPRAPKILRDMLAIPTAPFAEHLVIDYIERFCHARPGLTVTRDAAGNVLVRVRIGRRSVARPVCITAHLDHPGFVADRMITRTRLRAHWRGGVPPELFVDSCVRFHVDHAWVRGTIRSVKLAVRAGRRRVDTATLDVPGAVPPGAIGMWDFPDPTVRNTRIYARGCDDVAGAAAALVCIDRLVRRKLTCDAYFLFTRAEEVGFVGAIAAAKLGTIPKRCIVVAMETSAERPHARIGDGPILRVGDLTSTFTPEATAYGHGVAEALAASNTRFRFQRTLMDGGTCESSAFCALGYDATGICIALGNYHNVNARRGRLAPEYVDLNDFANVVTWFVALARARRPYTGRDNRLLERLDRYERQYRTLLQNTVAGPG